MEKEKILDYLDDLSEAYKEPTQRLPGLERDPKDIIRTVEFYTSNKYLSGNKDDLGKDKPFYNVCNYRVTVAKIATDLDLKDIKYEPDSLQYSLQTMMINKELFKFLKEINLSKTLNEMGLTRPKYGGVLVKKSEIDGLNIEVVDWLNVDFDPGDVIGGAIIETFYMQPSEFSAKAGVWKQVSEVLEAHAKANKGKPTKIEIKEVSGEFPETFDSDIEEGDENKFKRMCFYVACVGKKKFLLYKEDQKKPVYKYSAWEAVGKGLGRGIVEDGFESQWAINDTMISLKNAMDLTTKVVGKTTSKKVGGNVNSDISSGHIFELEQNADISFQTLGQVNMQQFQIAIDLWNQQYDRVSSSFNANTGEAPTAGTPYSQTALLNQVANSPFEYQREVWGIFLNEILNEWVLPHVKKRILKPHNLIADYTEEELEKIDEAIANYNVSRNFVQDVLNDRFDTTQEDVDREKGDIKKQLMKRFSNKREVEIMEKWLDVDGKITANITGEMKNKSAILQSLDNVFAKLVSTYNPQTGTFAAIEDPTLSKIFGQIMESAGIPISFAQLQSGKVGTVPAQSFSATASTAAPITAPTTAPTTPDLSAIKPIKPQI
jgi:hypothetical protein